MVTLLGDGLLAFFGTILLSGRSIVYRNPIGVVSKCSFFPAAGVHLSGVLERLEGRLLGRLMGLEDRLPTSFTGQAGRLSAILDVACFLTGVVICAAAESGGSVPVGIHSESKD